MIQNPLPKLKSLEKQKKKGGKKTVKTMACPSMSLDLNPVQHLFGGILKRSNKNTSIKAELEIYLKKGRMRPVFKIVHLSIYLFLNLSWSKYFTGHVPQRCTYFWFILYICASSACGETCIISLYLPKIIRVVIVVFSFFLSFFVLWAHCLAKSLWGSLNRLPFPSGKSIQVTDTESWLQSQWPLKSWKCLLIFSIWLSLMCQTVIQQSPVLLLLVTQLPKEEE